MNYELPYVATFKKVSFTQFKKDVLNLFEDYFTTAYTNEAELDKQLLLMYNDIKIPTRSTTGAVGYDFYLPLRSNIQHPHAFFTDKKNKCERVQSCIKIFRC